MEDEGPSLPWHCLHYHPGQCHRGFCLGSKTPSSEVSRVVHCYVNSSSPGVQAMGPEAGGGGRRRAEEPPEYAARANAVPDLN
jgi:hypothetical protein